MYAGWPRYREKREKREKDGNCHRSPGKREKNREIWVIAKENREIRNLQIKRMNFSFSFILSDFSFVIYLATLFMLGNYQCEELIRRNIREFSFHFHQFMAKSNGNIHVQISRSTILNRRFSVIPPLKCTTFRV